MGEAAENAHRIRAFDTALRGHEQSATAVAHSVATINASLRGIRKQLRAINRLLEGDAKNPPLAIRLTELEKQAKERRRAAEARERTVREIVVQVLPQALVAVGSAIFGAVVWYLSQRTQGK